MRNELPCVCTLASYGIHYVAGAWVKETRGDV